MSLKVRTLGAGVLAGALALAAAPLQAVPTHGSIVPPDDTRVLAGQRFDIRVEGQGRGPYSARLRVDGRNVRGTSLPHKGWHTLTADFSDGEGLSGWARPRQCEAWADPA